MDDFSEKFVLSALKDIAEFMCDNRDVEAGIDVYRLRAELQAKWSSGVTEASNVIPLPQRQRA